MRKGWARTKREEQILIEAGVQPRHIYLKGRGSEGLDAIQYRKDDELWAVHGLRALGDSRKDILAELERIHSADAAVVDCATKERSDKRGAEMLGAAIGRIAGEKTIASPGHARKMQAAATRAKLKDRKRMNLREAQAIWRRSDLIIPEKLAKMRGWAQSSAYRELGGTGIPSGRRGKKEK